MSGKPWHQWLTTYAYQTLTQPHPFDRPAGQRPENGSLLMIYHLKHVTENRHRKCKGLSPCPASVFHRIRIHFPHFIQTPIMSPILKAMTMSCKVLEIDLTPWHNFCTFLDKGSSWVVCALENVLRCSLDESLGLPTAIGTDLGKNLPRIRK